MVFAAANPSGCIQTGRRRGAATPAALATLTVVAVALVGLDPGAVCTLPALALLALLALRRYPGERILAAPLREAWRARRRRRHGRVSFASSLQVAVPRGGLLLAWSLAVRPPPRIPLAAG